MPYRLLKFWPLICAALVSTASSAPSFAIGEVDVWADYIKIQQERDDEALESSPEPAGLADGGQGADGQEDQPRSHKVAVALLANGSDVASAGARAGRHARTAAPRRQAIVYTRVPRTTGVYDLTFKDGTRMRLVAPDIWDRLPDTSRIFHGFNAPGQLVLLDSDGTERVLYDCFKQEMPCVPLDPAVSLDGKMVLFSVYRGKSLRQPRKKGAAWPNQYLAEASGAQLHLVELKSGKVTPLEHSPGVFDISPTWLPDGRIMFASTRANTVRPFLDRISAGRGANPQLYIVDADGRNAVNVSPHEVSAAMHPYLLQSGRIAYSSQWLSHNLAYITNNGSINWPTTLGNMWLVMDTDVRGGDMNALLGAHRSSFKSVGGRTKNMKALHFLGQRHNGDICVSNYYRGNNLGLGDVYCWPPEPVGVEGKLPRFLPRGIYNVADWSKSNDEGSFRKGGVFLGKIGYPEGIAGNQLLLAVGRGFCTQVEGSVASFLKNAIARQPDKRACDVGLYRTTTIPSMSMSDLEPIVDHEKWHEFGARVINAREVSTTKPMQTADGSCQLASSDAGTAETSPHKDYNFNSNYSTSANNGGEIDGLSHGELAGIRFWEVLPNKSRKLTFKNSIGNRLRFLGDVMLLEDKSFKVQIPCDTPYIMAGIDRKGRVIKRDQVPQSLRSGEKRVCTGCHLHSRKGRPYEQSLAFDVAAKPLLVSKSVPSFEKDIKPIFERRCVACHEGDVPLMNYDDLVWDRFQKAVPEDMRVEVSASDEKRRRYGLQRPYSSKYVNTMFARESLLYWKAVNERTDGRSDSTYSDDIDFGADHPVGVSESELRTMAHWLDSGATQ